MLTAAQFQFALHKASLLSDAKMLNIKLHQHAKLALTRFFLSAHIFFTVECIILLTLSTFEYENFKAVD